MKTTLTASELRAEYAYRYQERLGILCEDQEPTPEQKRIAHEEATAACNELKAQNDL